MHQVKSKFQDWLKHAKDGMKAKAAAAAKAAVAAEAVEAVAAEAAAKATEDTLDEESGMYSSSSNTSDDELYY